MKKIVTIGGGTGHFQILRGLKHYESEITAIVNMSDDGGSSGRLRDEYGVLPPGDIRQCMIALAPEGESRTLRELFGYRFEKDGHSMGNLIITALNGIFGDPAVAIKEASKILNITGKVLPVTINDVRLIAECDDGLKLNGEKEIYNLPIPIKINKIYHKPQSFLYGEAGRAIREADKIIICPGDLYASIIPNFIVEGMQKALEESKAQKIYVCNLFTRENNNKFKASDFIKKIEEYSGTKMDKILINSKIPSEEVMKEYFSEHCNIVEDDLGYDERVIRGEFAGEYSSEPNIILRHIPEKIAHAIIGL